MRRQFLNIVVRHPRFYALHRMKLSNNLFYEATENATAQQVAKAETKKDVAGWPPTFLNFKDLPRPVFFFPSQPAKIQSHFFSLLPAQGEGCVMFADPSADVAVYDADTKSPFAMRPADFVKPANAITLSVTDQRGGARSSQRKVGGELYVMSTEDGSFERFDYYRTTRLSAYHDHWCWESLPDLPSPPFAAAMVDSYTICASSKEGTYASDVFGYNMWSQAGTWTLPFHGAAEYVPKFRLWFGLEDPKSSQHRLCAFDLASSDMADSAPAPLHAWDYLDGLPDGWCPSERRLVNLGMGKFCIATHCFHRPSPSPEAEDYMKEVKVVSDELTVLTGVEVVRARGKLQMIKHKSRHYSQENVGIHCVL